MCHRVLTVFAIATIFSFSSSISQQLDCSVQVNYEAVGTTQKDLLVDFQNDIQDYLNHYKWGDDESARVKCALSIFIKSSTGENRYSAQAVIETQRLIFNTDQSSRVVRLLDEVWEFTYIRNRPINHSLYSFEELGSFLDFYAYLMLGYDYDTYEPGGGTPWYQKAADVANLGRSSGAKGWELKTSTYSRIQLIDEILSPKFSLARRAMCTYYFTGLDSLSLNRPRALGNVLVALEVIGKARREVNPQNIYIKSFFESNYREIAQLFATHRDRAVFTKLSVIDPVHRTTYEEYAKKK